MMKRLMVILLVFFLSVNIASADPSIDSFKAKTILGGIVELSFTVSDPDGLLDHLELYKSAELIKDFKITGSTHSDIYNDNAAVGGETYGYRIVAHNTNGNKVENVVEILVDNVPPKLTSPKTVTTNQKTITIETDENSICGGAAKGENVSLLAGNEKSHPLSAEFVEGQNIISVMCTDGSSNEFAAPEDITVIFDSTKPSKPTLDVKLEGNIAKLSWATSTDGNGMKGYTIYRSPDGNVFDPINTVTGTTFEEAIQAATYYAVGAVDNAGNEERSDVKTAQSKSSVIIPTTAAVLDTANLAPGSKKSRAGLALWGIFLAVAIAGLWAFFRKKNDKFGMNSYLSRRSKMR